MKTIPATLAAMLLFMHPLFAQNKAITPDTLKITSDTHPGTGFGFTPGKDSAAAKARPSIWIGSGGIHYENGQDDSTEHRFRLQFGMLDLGVNTLVDHTTYLNEDQLNSKAIYPIDRVLNVDRKSQNKELFSLRQGKSINVNIYPVLVKARLYSSRRQKITLASGIGLQLYNFRFTKPVTYVASPTTHVILDTVSFSKNKLAFNYLTVPLMLNGKTKLSDVKGSKTGSGLWLVYGGGISAGYLLSSWTKQISDERGKDKNHDPFNFRKTNLCVNGEIGIDGYFRMFASYQLTALHEGDVLDQHPFSIGIRFLGF